MYQDDSVQLDPKLANVPITLPNVINTMVKLYTFDHTDLFIISKTYSVGDKFHLSIKLSNLVSCAIRRIMLKPMVGTLHLITCICIMWLSNGNCNTYLFLYS